MKIAFLQIVLISLIFFGVRRNRLQRSGLRPRPYFAGLDSLYEAFGLIRPDLVDMYGVGGSNWNYVLSGSKNDVYESSLNARLKDEILYSIDPGEPFIITIDTFNVRVEKGTNTSSLASRTYLKSSQIDVCGQLMIWANESESLSHFFVGGSIMSAEVELNGRSTTSDEWISASTVGYTLNLGYTIAEHYRVGLQMAAQHMSVAVAGTGEHRRCSNVTLLSEIFSTLSPKTDF